MPTPVRCMIRPLSLRVRVPTDRPGVLEPRPPMDWARSRDQALMFARFRYAVEPVLVNGAPGVLSRSDGRPVALLSCTIAGGRIVAIDILADPGRLRGLGLD